MATLLACSVDAVFQAVCGVCAVRVADSVSGYKGGDLPASRVAVSVVADIPLPQQVAYIGS